MRGTANPQKQQMMLEENIKTLIPRMAVPTIVAQLVTTVYNLVDTYFVSTIGTQATAAVGVNSSLERMITLFGSLIGAGACSYIARLLGARKQEDADRVLSTSFFTGLGLGLVFMAIGLIAIRPMVSLLGANADCMDYAMQYAHYVLLATPFMIGSFILNMCLRSEGSAAFAMVGIGIGSVLNCFLDPLFIRTFGLGVAGASMATAISKTISFAILLCPYIRKSTSVRLSVRKIHYAAHDIKEVLSIGSTSFFRSALSVVSGVLINRVASAISTQALAALSVANRVMEFPFALILGFGQGYQPVVGYNWGAKQYKRVKESLQFSAAVSILGAVLVGGLIAIFAEVIVNIFNSDADASVLSTGILCIRLQCAVLFSHSLNSIINMFYAGIGKAKYAIAMSTARQGYVFIPVALILPHFLGVAGVASAQAVADLLCLAISIPLTVKAFRLIAENRNTSEIPTT